MLHLQQRIYIKGDILKKHKEKYGREFMNNKDEWRDFNNGEWSYTIDVNDFIKKNFSLYSAFLTDQKRFIAYTDIFTV